MIKGIFGYWLAGMPGRLIAHFFLVSESKNQHDISLLLVVIEGDIAGVPESDNQLSQIGFVFKWPAHVWLRCQGNPPIFSSGQK
jgi:hypothetical protein